MKLLMKFVFMLFVASQLLACSEEDSMQCATSERYCPTTSQYVQACCTSSQCEYRTGGTTFPCSGTSCDSTVPAVLTYCGVTAKTTSPAEMDLSKALLIEKADNVYLRQSIDQMYNDLGNEVQSGQ